MIQDIFLPEKIDEYYLFSQRIVGIDITKSHIHATVLLKKGKTTIIEKQLTEALNNDIQDYNERVITQLSVIMKAVGRVDQIRTAISSTAVVFKELRMPFISRDKINMVVRFEVEPLLPFRIQDVVIDFIITDINREEQTAQILVAAIQKHHIAHHLSLYEQAGINPTTITVDMFALYGLYTQIPDYMALSGSVVVLDLDMHMTRIMVIDNQHVRIIRTLPYGVATIAKDAGTEAAIKPTEVVDHLIRFGINDTKSEKNEAVINSLTTYFNKIQFALNSTISSLQNTKISNILLVGAGSEIKDISSFVTDIITIPCQLFNAALLANNKQYQISKNITMQSFGLISLAIAIVCPSTEDFNLEKEEFAPPQTKLILKQGITAIVLIFIIISSLIIHSIVQSSHLNHEITSSQTDAIESLKERFSEIPEDEESLDDVIELAQNELAKEEAIWMAFSRQARASFLEYLFELSTLINKQQLGFVPEQLVITDGTIGQITLKARVRDFEALKQLEHVLRQSKLFSYVEGQTTPDFTMKITIASNR